MLSNFHFCLNFLKKNFYFWIKKSFSNEQTNKKKPIQIHIYPSLLRIDQSIDRFIDPIDSLFESIKKVSEFFIFAESSSRSSSSKSEKPKSFKKCWIPLKNNNNGKNEKRISTSRQNTSREKKNLQHNLTGNGFFSSFSDLDFKMFLSYFHE